MLPPYLDEASGRFNRNAILASIITLNAVSVSFFITACINHHTKSLRALDGSQQLLDDHSTEPQTHKKIFDYHRRKQRNSS